MRRRNPFGSTRTRKVRPAITVKVKPASRTAKCSACRMRIIKGEEATYVRVRTRRFHKACTPPNIGAPPTTAAVSSTPVMPNTEHDAQLFAMLALENALGVKSKALGYPEDLDKVFDKYKKFKEHVLRPGCDAEGKQALRLAMIEVIKATF